MPQRRSLVTCLALLLAGLLVACGGSSDSADKTTTTEKRTTTTAADPCIQKVATFLNDELDLNRLDDEEYMKVDVVNALGECDLNAMSQDQINEIANLLDRDVKAALNVPTTAPSTVPLPAQPTTTAG
jgi:hypothetical protein